MSGCTGQERPGGKSQQDVVGLAQTPSPEKREAEFLAQCQKEMDALWGGNPEQYAVSVARSWAQYIQMGD